MAEKSARRLALERSLEEEPGDPFLRYGLALQCLREGDLDEGRERLRVLIAEYPEEQIAAYQQLGQSYVETGDQADARVIFRLGIAKALACGDGHAAAEMQAFLDQLG